MAEPLTKRELINALEAIDVPDDMAVRIFDYKKNMHGDTGDGSSEGVYRFDVEIVNSPSEWSADEIKFYKDRHDGEEPKPWLALSFDNPDLED